MIYYDFVLNFFKQKRSFITIIGYPNGIIQEC